jgi:hypothetical protein
MAWNHKSRVVAMAVAIQAVAGAFTAPTDADLIPVAPPTNSEDIIQAEDPTATGTVHAAPRIYLGKTGSAGATAPLRGPGGAAVFAAGGWPLGRVLQAAGFAEVINAAPIADVLQAGSTTTALALAAGEPATDDIYIGFPIQQANIGAGAIKGTSLIEDYNGTSKVATIAETMGVAPAAAAAYTIPECVVYQLGTLSTSPPLLSVSIWRDKKRYDYKDVRVSQLTFDMPVSNEQNQVFPSVEFTLKGLVEAVADEASPSLTAAQLTSIPPYRNGKFSLDKVALGHQSTRFQMGADVAGASNSHAADGQDSYEIMSTTRTLDMDLNQMAVTDFDIETRVNNQTTVSQMSLWGQGAGNRFGFLAPSLKLDPLNNPGDRNGFVSLSGNAAFVAVDKSATLAIWW